MKRTFMLALVAIAIATTGATSVFAQGIQSGTIRGTIKDQQNLAVPGVTVTATSPSLQGSRIAISDGQGLYTINALPPGAYTLKFTLSGFGDVTQTMTLPLGLVVEQNAVLKAAGVAEAVQVTAAPPTPIATGVVGGNYKHEEIEALATPRTLEGIATLSPGVTENSTNAGQIVVNGAMAFDNIFMINGVDVNDNLFATPQNLFIEDAIEETQVLTAGISAEYGRFTGGVVNAITKSGGNIFTGSGRVNFLDPAWTTATPYEVTKGIEDTAHPSQLQERYEGTFGGPIVKDRLWFFSSGRYQNVNQPATLPQTGATLPQETQNKRFELKLTGTVAPGHTIAGGFLTNSTNLTNNSGLFSYVIDPHSLVNYSEPNNYFYTNYKGVLGSSLLVEAQYSQRHFRFDGDGGTSTAITDSPFLSATQCACLYNAPYFDATDGENRNNKQLTGSVTKFWNRGGRHETKGGYEWFRSQRTGGNSQSSTSYVFSSDFVTNADGTPQLDSTGRPIPMFVPGTSFLDYYPAVRGAVLNVDNNSLYVQDHWTISSRMSADLGARYEHVKALSTGDIQSVDVGRIVPRLGLAYALDDNGDKILHFNYGQYSGRYNEAQIAANSPVGNPADIEPIYRGPAGQGYGFAPGFNLANYPVNSANATVTDPVQNVVMDPNLISPLVHEFSASFGTKFMGDHGYGEVSYVARITHDLIEDYQTLSTGVTDVTVNGVSAGLFTNKLYTNAPNDQVYRHYQGLVFQTRYRINSAWSVYGADTVQLQNTGDYEGEATNQPGNTSPIGNFPEAFSVARTYPFGDLQNAEKNRLRLWSVYSWDMHSKGNLTFSGLWRLESGLAYSIAARNQPLTSQQVAILAAAGYPDLPGAQTVFFTGERGDQTFAGYGVIDMSINYDIPVFRTVKPWIKIDVYNLFNNEKLIAWNTTVSQNVAGGVDALGLATNYTKGSTFGTATGNTVTNLNNANINTFPLAFSGAQAGGRTLRMAIGVRF
ncbi:MAG TPA: carboxypeptidase regulatory-like domain-containing protein [Vicinamibacterales bacterium]